MWIKNFDVVYRVLTIADKKACLYFIDGFTKDDSLLKILQGFSSIKADDMPEDAHSFSKNICPMVRSVFYLTAVK